MNVSSSTDIACGSKTPRRPGVTDPSHGHRTSLWSPDRRRPTRRAVAGALAVSTAMFGLMAVGTGVATASSVKRLLSLSLPPKAALSGVSCTSSDACTAVGYYYVQGRFLDLTLAEAWNGTRWVVQSTPDPAGAISNDLLSVSCTSPEACMAVGDTEMYSKQGRGPELTLAEAWNGFKWSILPTPVVAGATASLSGVSCTSAWVCTAVGSYEASNRDVFPLAEGWNGTKWAIESTRVPADVTRTYLASVSCTSSRVCIAVGSGLTSPSTGFALIEVWNGTKWAIPPTPSRIQGYLSGVSCSAPRACTAVGAYAKGFLAEAWNGAQWTTQSAPKPKGLLREDIFMADVSCPSSACTADGFYINGKGNDDTAVEAWNGTRWVVQATLDPSIGMNGVTSSILAAVSCSSPKACTAVGDDEDDKDAWVPLVERWNGAGWVTQPTPALSTEGRVTSAQVAAGLTALTPGMAHAIVTITGGGYEAAVYDKTGHIDFWKFSGTKWAEVGRSSYPRLQPFPTPLGSVVGRQLKGMADATFIARGIFTGDSTGQTIAFGKGQRGWGTIAWGPGNVLVPTGNGSTDNDTPGIYFNEQLSAGQLETTSLNPYFSTAMNYYPLTANWSWDARASHFIDVRDNAFTSSLPKFGKALKDGGPLLSRCSKTPLNGTYEVMVQVGTPASFPHMGVGLPVAVHAIEPLGVGKATCDSQVLPADMLIVVQGATKAHSYVWITAPAWLFVVPNTGAVPLTVQSAPVGTTPWVVPPSLHIATIVSDLGTSAPNANGGPEEPIDASCTFARGVITGLVVNGSL